MAFERYDHSLIQLIEAETNANQIQSEDELRLLNRQGKLYSQIEKTFSTLRRRQGFSIGSTVVTQIDEPDRDTQYLPENFLKVIDDLKPDRMTIRIKRQGMLTDEYKMMIQLMQGKISGPRIEIDVKDDLFDNPKAVVRYFSACSGELSREEKELSEKYPHDGKFPKDYEGQLSHTDFGQRLADWALK